MLARWDTAFYHSIATAGYRWDPDVFQHDNIVFFPLYPLLMRWGGALLGGHPLLAGLRPGDELYFVHSYYLDPSDQRARYAVTDYGGDFCCAIGRDNLFATQFHPEKSGRLGLDLLQRFARWDGTPC